MTPEQPSFKLITSIVLAGGSAIIVYFNSFLGNITNETREAISGAIETG